MEKNVEENCKHCCYVLGVCISDIVCKFILLRLMPCFNFCVRCVCEITAAHAENGYVATIGVKINFGAVCE
jgi:hypothetical protein